MVSFFANTGIGHAALSCFRQSDFQLQPSTSQELVRRPPKPPSEQFPFRFDATAEEEGGKRVPRRNTFAGLQTFPVVGGRMALLEKIQARCQGQKGSQKKHVRGAANLSSCMGADGSLGHIQARCQGAKGLPEETGSRGCKPFQLYGGADGSFGKIQARCQGAVRGAANLSSCMGADGSGGYRLEETPLVLTSKGQRPYG